MHQWRTCVRKRTVDSVYRGVIACPRMQLTRQEFDGRIAENNLTLTFIGMSGIGKTHRARQFVPLGFRHRSCDTMIALHVSSVASLQNVADVGVWMGQPYSEGYRSRERQYLKLENAATKDILGTIEGNTVIDTTGSVIYAPMDTQQRLKKDSLVIYFEASPEIYERMLEVYLDDPKPVVWGDVFRSVKGEGEQGTFKRCYPILLESRAKKYKELADITVPYEVMRDSWWDGERLFEVIREYVGKGQETGGSRVRNSSALLSSPDSIAHAVRGKVLKFGGTSMGSPEAMRKVIDIIRNSQKDPKISAVVVSAMSGVTDELISIAQSAAAKDDSYQKKLDDLGKRHRTTLRALVKNRGKKIAQADVKNLLTSLNGVVHGVRLVEEISPRVLDYILSHGERLSGSILAHALVERKVACEFLDASKLVVTNNNFGEAVVDFQTTNQRIRAYVARTRKLQIVTGFVGATPEGVVTTLGRGGSDYTASIIGAALGASSIEIWTDVSGVFTADPRKVKNVQPITTMTYEEASEMSYFGAKVIHPPTMLPARKKGIPILIKNAFDPDAPGTVIGKVSEHPRIQTDAVPLAKGISTISNISMLRVEGSGMIGVHGSAGRIFGALARAKVNVILITQSSSEYSISIAVAPRDAEDARRAIDTEFAFEHQTYLVDPVVVEHDLSILAVVGERMRHRSGVAARFFGALGKGHINVVAVAQGSSELNVSVVISKSDEMRALEAVHEAFFEPRKRHINIFLVGTGLIGSTLLKQIASQVPDLEGNQECVVRVAAVANHKNMLLDAHGIDLKKWDKALARSKQKMDIGQLIEAMKNMNLLGSVFVDCTASAEIASRYADVLAAGISIVTPNKKANSGTLAYYRELKHTAALYGANFLYETNVGAGLPIIGTLGDLLQSGDRIRKIEAVLSGTLSYIFNTFHGDAKFSQVVRQAKDYGYTEPDPRDDLAGTDVARKILILGREMGLPLELKDIEIETLLSRRAREAPTIERFFAQLEKEDAVFGKKKNEAERKGSRLRYIATLEKGHAKVSLESVGSTHPFYQLSGSDNMIAFTTDRYNDTPLVVRGPGAGAEVTAAGVFADILRTSQ